MEGHSRQNPVQGAHHQVMVAKPSAFDDFHQIGARLGRNHVVRLETVHQCGELVLAQRQRRGRDDDVLRHVPCRRGPISRGSVAPIAGDLQRGLHADDRNVKRFRIVLTLPLLPYAGNHDGLGAFGNQKTPDRKTPFLDVFGVSVAVGCIKAVAVIKDVFAGKRISNSVHHREAAES